MCFTVNMKIWFSALVRAMAIVLLSAPLGAVSQDYPDRPLRILVPYSPGGLPDTIARVIAQRLQESFKQAVYVENRPGASGSVAAAAVAQAPADGYTLLVTDGPLLSIGPYLMKNVPYDAVKDFVPVSLLGTAPLFLAVNSNVKATTLDQLITLARAEPGVLNYGSSGVGSIHQLTGEAMKAALGISITHIPFRGSANAVPALVAGQVDMVFASPPTLMPFVKSGKVRLLAINSAKRSLLAPDVPTLGETISGFDFAFTVVMFARSGTPPEVVSRLYGEISGLVKRADVVEQFQAAGVDAIGAGPDQTRRALEIERARIKNAAARANLKAE